MELPRIDKVPSVATVMTPFPYSVDVGASVDEAERLMREHDVDQLPVQDGSALVGLDTERQLIELRTAAAEGTGILTVDRLTLRKPYVVDIHTPVGKIAAAMAQQQHDAALVVRDGRLAGIFTTTDACRTLAAICGQNDPAGDDEVA